MQLPYTVLKPDCLISKCKEKTINYTMKNITNIFEAFIQHNLHCHYHHHLINNINLLKLRNNNNYYKVMVLLNDLKVKTYDPVVPQ